MKRFMKMMLAAILVALPMFGFAQDLLSNETMSRNYKNEIGVKAAELKTLKAKLKMDKDNADLKQQIKEKQIEIKDLKDKKKVVDQAIKTQKSSEKAIKKAEKAREKAEKAAKKADNMKKDLLK